MKVKTGQWMQQHVGSFVMHVHGYAPSYLNWDGKKKRWVVVTPTTIHNLPGRLTRAPLEKARELVVTEFMKCLRRAMKDFNVLSMFSEETRLKLGRFTMGFTNFMELVRMRDHLKQVSVLMIGLPQAQQKKFQKACSRAFKGIDELSVVMAKNLVYQQQCFEKACFEKACLK